MDNTKELILPNEGMIDAKTITKFLGISLSMWSKLQKAGAVEPPVKIGSSARWDVNFIRELAKTGVSLPKKKAA